MNQYPTSFYERKLRKLRKTIKTMTFENAALCDLVSEIQDNILVVKEERKFLLRKLLEYEGTENLIVKKRTNSEESYNKNKSTVKKQKVPSAQSILKKQIKQEPVQTFQVNEHGMMEFSTQRHVFQPEPSE